MLSYVMANYKNDIPVRDSELIAQNDFTSKSVDALLYYLFDTNLNAEEKTTIRDTLIGSTKPKVPHFKSNKSIVTNDFCAKYAQLRALGLTQRDAATMLNITVHRLESMLHGEELDSKAHAMLLHAEASSEAALKERCLRTISNAVEDGNWKAAVTLLEKKFPEEYGRKLEVKSNTSVRWTTEECESAAQQAHKDLERIRSGRNTSIGLDDEALYVEASPEK